MDLSDKVLGSHIANQIRVKNRSTLLKIGKDEFTRKDLGQTECYNFNAAANLSNILNHELQVKDTRDVFNNIAPSALALPRLGAISIAVLGAAFEAKGLGGDSPLENWMARHLEKDQELHSFVSYKRPRDKDTEEARRRERKAARRNSAHKLRVDRFTARQRK